MNDYRLPAFPAPFNQGWTLKDTRAWHAHELVAPDFESTDPDRDHQAEQAWREGHLAFRERFALALGQHAMHLADTPPGLVVPPHTEAVDQPFVNAWRKAAAQDPLERREALSIGYALLRSFEMAVVRLSPNLRKTDTPPPTPEALHDELATMALAGTFESFYTEMTPCQRSGLHLNLNLKGWVPSLQRFDHAQRKFFPLGEGDVAFPKIHHARIPVPSGTLLVSDWFRHDAFNAAVDALTKGEPSINSAAGCETRTRTLAEGLGVAAVYVGNTGPSAIAGEEGVRVGSWDYDNDPDAEPENTIITDLWWATMMDKQRLVDLLAKTMAPEDAVREVDHLIATQPNTIHALSVPPGDYHLYYAGEPEDFPGLFEQAGLEFEGAGDAMFVLSRTELAPRPRRGSAPKR